MLAQTLALALVVASPGSRPAQTGLALQTDNSARARRGLLPRKVVQAPRRVRGRLLRPDGPTWLGEPGEVSGEEPEAVVEPTLDGAVVPAVARAVTALQVGAPPLPLRAAIEEVAVEAFVLRPRAAPPVPVLRAPVARPRLEAMFIRRAAVAE